jgi:hypothetical protein
MKKLLFILLIVLGTGIAIAQSPMKFSYQAVIRNSSQQLVANASVGMRTTIYRGSVSGQKVYEEVKTVLTNANGLISIEIGGGPGFDTISWGNGPFFLQTETDPAGGSNYSITGAQQLLSVPYAIHSMTAESVTGPVTETDPVFSVHPASGITPVNLTNWNTAYSWGNHSGLYKPVGYTPAWNDITSKPTTVAGYGITDAMTTSHAAFSITSAAINNWNTAFGWGNHTGLYKAASWLPGWNDVTGKPNFSAVATSGNYNDLTNKPLPYTAGTNITISGANVISAGFTETDPIFSASVAAGITSADTAKWNNLFSPVEYDPVFSVHPASTIAPVSITNWNTAFGWGNHAGLYKAALRGNQPGVISSQTHQQLPVMVLQMQ